MGQAQAVKGKIMEGLKWNTGNKRGVDTVLEKAEGRLCLMICWKFRNATDQERVPESSYDRKLHFRESYPTEFFCLFV
jgi:hypothetical protein